MSKRIDLSRLRLFYEIALEKSVSRAADKLNMSQPALSRILLLFEDRIKTKLFDRLPSGMHLTLEGKRLYEHAKKLLVAHNAFEKEFYDTELEGEIKVITTPFVGAEWLVPQIPEFLDRYPKLRIKVLLRSENLELAEADVAICLYRSHQPHLCQEPLFTTHVRLFASPGYLETFGSLRTVEDLDHHRLITYRGDYYSSYGSTNWILHVGRDTSRLPRESFFEIDSLHGMFNGALQGLGVAELPDYSCVLESPLVDVLPKLLGPETPIYYIFPERRKSSKKLQTFLKYLREKGK